MPDTINGYIIEADKPGFFYHRSGAWVPYQTAAQGYVWTADQASSIRDAANPGWALKPTHAHPAIYHPSTGTTILTGAPDLVTSVAGNGPVDVPTANGTVFDLKTVSQLAPGSVTALSMSL